MDNIDVDVAGMDILNKNYSILIVYNNTTKIGYKVNQELLDYVRKMYGLFNSNKISRGNLKGRLYSAIVVLLIRKLIKREGSIEAPRLIVCPDLDGHQEQIRSMLFDNLKKDMPALTKEEIRFARHPRKSVIQQCVTNLYHSNSDSIIICNLDKEEIWGLITKSKKESGNKG